ncbi:glycosyltransferase family 2 protein [Fretibacter rubidus]|uniref:glycosyltransferase family 2 protein n=1 Tax=Fretibacter rubidus TaxID=570162 RepID=UPI00352A9824
MTAPFATDITLIQSPGAVHAVPSLSVLVPYYHDDPSALMQDLQSQMSPDVELIFYDDGTGDAALNARLGEIVQKSAEAITLMIADKNKGRSEARNALQKTARADWILFLDADMRPGSDSFLTRYKAAITKGDSDIIFGGFTVSDRAERAEQELHRALSHISDCLPLAERKAAGAQFVASSNLCVRKAVLTAQPFDDGFTGWGWEDSEWAARVAKDYRLTHIDNSALHLGLETDTTLLARFKSSAQNYIRFTDKHPELATTLSLYRLSKKLSRVPGQGLLRPIYRAAVVIRFLPMRLRVLGLKLWRASWYASAFNAEARRA